MQATCSYWAKRARRDILFGKWLSDCCQYLLEAAVFALPLMPIMPCWIRPDGSRIPPCMLAAASNNESCKSPSCMMANAGDNKDCKFHLVCWPMPALARTVKLMKADAGNNEECKIPCCMQANTGSHVGYTITFVCDQSPQQQGLQGNFIHWPLPALLTTAASILHN